jgi:hypothetical protein
MDDKRSHTPFPWDEGAMARMRPDQVPRFLGAVTDPSPLPVKTVDLNAIYAMQNRVDEGKVRSIMDVRRNRAAAGADGGKMPIVVRMDGRDYIADGHHRLAASWLAGDDTADVKFKDLTARSNAVKRRTRETVGDLIDKDAAEVRISFDVQKMDEDQRLVFGWASIVEKAGKLIVDKQDDIILPADLEAAAYDYVLDARKADDMHTAAPTARLVESIVFTLEKQEHLGIVVKDEDGDQIVGWWCGWYVDSDAQWALIKSGARPELSIGGSSVRVPFELSARE